MSNPNAIDQVKIVDAEQIQRALEQAEKDPLGNQEDEITITPLGIALGIAVEMGIVSKEDPNVLVKFRNYWDKVEKYVLPYAFERMKEGEADHINTPPNSQ